VDLVVRVRLVSSCLVPKLSKRDVVEVVTDMILMRWRMRMMILFLSEIRRLLPKTMKQCRRRRSLVVMVAYLRLLAVVSVLLQSLLGLMIWCLLTVLADRHVSGSRRAVCCPSWRRFVGWGADIARYMCFEIQVIRADVWFLCLVKVYFCQKKTKDDAKVCEKVMVDAIQGIISYATSSVDWNVKGGCPKVNDQ